LSLCTYSIIFLLTHPEFSVREYAELTIAHLLPQLPLSLFKVTENKIVSFLRTVREEMTMRTVMSAFRSLVLHSKTMEVKTASKDLIPLLGQEQ
jgi:hypothetical protein